LISKPFLSLTVFDISYCNYGLLKNAPNLINNLFILRLIGF